MSEGTRGRGRPKGVPNKVTRDIKAAVLEAFEKAGGPAYLARQADENPTAFMTLLGKVLPTQISNADGEGGFKIVVTTNVDRSLDA